ncbi:MULTISPECIES: diphosphate--fructose-6-phosphate 1-phosphotransferase [Mesobacillus]|uniref:Pyrophosphate--fructose 6-phosphate 1-phosphotransferase n=2 Tax=Mesobacillus TaxID=2675231 RepID=A0A0D6ZER6_9BACI|nr:MULTISPECIES: diphosphate--fructose-6-phosphate 1-phosphotransferase [Mesobacillus]KIY23108.1 6-phosphofructokinase [Mesobacillus subterraneus]MDQ0415304.1 6-phosphofructokinase 1 [Mesobacillus stamsii]
MKNNILIVHGGGPTAVLNSSLYGVIKEAQNNICIDKIYGAIGGSEAILKENFLDLGTTKDADLDLLLQTPGTAIGSSRFPLKQEHYEKMPDIFKKHDIKYVLFNGGNGTMEACGRVHEVCKNEEIYVIGIPKTIDNDIAIIDHAPGYGSAAKFLAHTTAEIGADVKSLPIHVTIIEAMGRNAGWITAASALARKRKEDAPHLIYLPERPFVEEEFMEDVKELYDRLGGVVVVVSEGLKNAEQEPIVPPIFQRGRSVYYGDVSEYLANLVIKRLGIKARGEKPGLAGRTSIALQSKIDQEEAVLVGRTAVQAAVSGRTGVMVGIRRLPEEKYSIETFLVPIQEVMLHEKKLPDHFINERGNNVTEKFIQWCKPLIGEELPEFLSFKDKEIRK